MKNEDLLYFKDNDGYKRIFMKIYEKYRSLGRIGGTVTLDSATSAEREILSSHLRQDYSRMSSVTFKVNDFEDSLKHTRFADYTLKEILEAYFDEPLISRGEEARRFQRERNAFFCEIMER